MEFVSPIADPQFPHSRAHGAAAQLTTLLQVVGMCSQRRTAVDVGAHIGTWTVELAKRFSVVYAFEPQPENFACLNVNAGGNVCIENVALSYGHGRCAVAQHGANSGCWRVAPGNEVTTRSLDSYGLTEVDLLKIDVEGYEGHVLLGATRTLVESSPVVIFEDNGLGEKLYGADWVDPKPILADLGYSLRRRIHKDEIWCA